MKRARQTLYMETTKIAATKTVGEIIELLASIGAEGISTSYESGRPGGMAFTLRHGTSLLAFKLPARIEPGADFLWERGKRTKSKWRYRIEDHQFAVLDRAERVAWRQLLRWIQAQAAMIQTGMVEAAEVFAPYVQDSSGRTLYDVLSGGGFAMLAIAPPQNSEGGE